MNVENTNAIDTSSLLRIIDQLQKNSAPQAPRETPVQHKTQEPQLQIAPENADLEEIDTRPSLGRHINIWA